MNMVSSFVAAIVFFDMFSHESPSVWPTIPRSTPPDSVLAIHALLTSSTSTGVSWHVSRPSHGVPVPTALSTSATSGRWA